MKSLLTLCILLSSFGLTASSFAAQPNIVFIMADDLGWADPGFNGGDARLTPNIDKFAKQGTRFTQFYMTPVCATTRAALMTGRYPFRQWMDWRSEDFGKPDYLALLGMKLAHLPDGTPTRRVMGLPTEERTVAEALKEAGYSTALVGKWHLGEWLPEELPMGQGFDHQYGHYAWGIDYNNKTIPHNAPAIFAVYDWHRDQKPVFEKGYSTDLIADEAVRLIGLESKEKPFFHYIAFNAIHGPLEEIPRHVPELEKRAAAIKCLDEGLGRILEAIDKKGFADNTLVIFTNDNGGLTEEVNKPWRGTKNTTFEGGIRVPFIARWPGKVKPDATNDSMINVTDLLPTFVTIAGGSLKQKLPLDGMDMSAVMLEGKQSPRDEIVIEVAGSVRLPTLRKGDFKLVGKELFNLASDPYEKTDIAAQHPEVVAQMQARLKQIAAERPPLGDLPILMDPALPYVYGRDENKDVPDEIKSHVDAIRATQPKSYPPGTYPWPGAPKDGKVIYKGDGR
ncbi:sulfatase-like hydrolase/transferase [Prosthecobacter sp.]|uniref:sulfatase-like hydrolase/transferase n=1 Tax=Prosthecobacter sp. TaxID=1965333 RepID=UPI001DA97690|nr:sulfatase-like hydrolase/transferase [Prosthecobacter sp.]MCB1277384.1 sulfatase-like hydrolase/transferase [Prosthecobacter sp.]